MFILSISNSQKAIVKNLFSLGTDDGHHVVLESISEGVDCEHDYINATYIDVRFLKFLYMAVENDHQLDLLVNILLYNRYMTSHLTLRVILKARSTLPLKVNYIQALSSK